MTDSFVTQCPHCRTSFRVSRAQLGAAHGAVRCGACLHVFNAVQQLLGERATKPAAPALPSAPPPPPAESAPVPGPKPAETLWIHDDLDLDSLDLDEELAKLERQEQQFSQEFLALEQAPKGADSFLKPQEQGPDRHDERWAEALLRDEVPVPGPVSAPGPARDEAKDRLPPPPTSVVAPRPQSTAPAEPTHVPAAVEQPEEPEPEEPPQQAEADAAPGLARKGARRNEHAADGPALGDMSTVEGTLERGARQTERRERQRERRGEALLSLNDEPLQLDWQPPPKRWGRRIGWGLLNLLGVAALSFQYVHHHFDELARQDQYRPWFEQLCPSLGCSLPSKVEISLIKSSNLVVRSHPEFTGALVVDAILYNRAPFAQPFPLLEMRFADLNGQLLASRRFKPSEYLAGELAGQAEMPPQTPIHISLDILDPGTQAVNYSLSFHSPE
ncbi:MAG TPA: DUF3426 domain-containing protein [Pseudomonas sp.]|nr:DUF3426 domain-containing protein [Pseudomonas sp.]